MIEPTPDEWKPGKERGTIVSGHVVIARNVRNPADVPLIAAAKTTAEERDRLREVLQNIYDDALSGKVALESSTLDAAEAALDKAKGQS